MFDNDDDDNRSNEKIKRNGCHSYSNLTKQKKIQVKSTSIKASTVVQIQEFKEKKNFLGNSQLDTTKKTIGP